jgi:hypothetical protein
MSEPDGYATVPLPPPGPEREALVRDAILVGSLPEFMSYLPQTAAREEAEQRLADQEKQQALTAEQQEAVRQCAAQILADGVSRLCDRLDSYEEQRALAAKEAEEEQERRDQEEVRAYLAELPDPEQPEPLGTSDDNPLTPHEPVDPAKHGYPPAEDDAEGTGPVPLSYGHKGPPLSYTKSESSTDPMPLAPGPSEAKPEPGSRLYPPRPGISQPVSISLNSEREE